MICCLDLEGVLVPEVWIAVAKKTGIKELERTTRDEPNYDVLMRCRLDILRKNRITLSDVQKVIGCMKPLSGARTFLDKLRSKTQVVILSDTYYEFAAPLMKQLGYPALFCNWLEIDNQKFIKNYHLRQHDGKEKAVLALKNIGFEVIAAGDSYNDLSMLNAADKGVLFRPPLQIAKDNPGYQVTNDYKTLLKALLSA